MCGFVFSCFRVFVFSCAVLYAFLYAFSCTLVLFARLFFQTA